MSGALKSALRALRKNKVVDIKEAIVELGDGQQPLECIPTGSVVLDYLIGGYRTETGEQRCPGIPKGRITEIFGPEGSGKCVTAGTYVHSEYGMVTMAELFGISGYEMGTEEKIEAHEVELLNEFGEMETTSHLTWNGKRDVKRITTSLGYELEATGNHPIRVLDEQGYIVWKNASEIRTGDHVVLMGGHVKFPERSEVTPEEAEYLAQNRNRFPETLGSLRRSKRQGETPHKETDQVPVYIRRGTKEVFDVFIDEYVENYVQYDSWDKYYYLESESYEFMRQIQMMILSLGYLSQLIKQEEGEGYRLILGEQYLDSVGLLEEEVTGIKNETYIPNVSKLLLKLLQASFREDREGLAILGTRASLGMEIKKEDLQDYLEEYGNEGDLTSRNTSEYLQNLLDMGYYYDEVKEIEHLEGEPTYDVCLPETHSFWSNGMISHNTTIAIHSAIQAQRAGGTVCFLDYEHAFAPTYAADLGLDLLDDSFLLLQPKHWEEGAEIIQEMAKAGVDLIIVDSVAAMKPQRDIESNDVSSTGQVGHLARLQSSFLPKIVNTLEDKGTALIYINQLRSRIKTSMYDSGPDEETAGGRALKYYCSLRMEVKRIKTEYAQVESELTGKAEKQPISNIIRARNVKNKVSRHQGHTAEFVIRYGEGIDNVRSVIDIAEARKVITRAGAWYSFMDASGNEAKAQGKEGLRNHFLENPDDFQALVREVSSFTKDRETLNINDEDIEVEEHGEE